MVGLLKWCISGDVKDPDWLCPYGPSRSLGPTLGFSDLREPRNAATVPPKKEGARLALAVVPGP